MSSQPREINLDDDIDRLRYRCPRGHANWTAALDHFYCLSCAQGCQFEGQFHELRDETNGNMLGRDEIALEASDRAYKLVFTQE